MIKVSTPYRKMRDRAFRDEQHRGIRLPHIVAFNDLVDELCAEPGRGWMPYLAPLYGGAEARVLSVFQDPGPKTDDADGSGMLCVENDDPSAQYMSELLADAGISVSELIPWNAYPWYRHQRGKSRQPTAAEREAGVEPLHRVIGLMPRLRVVMLHGGTARDVWDRFGRRHRSVARPLRVVRSFHTSRQAFIGTAEERNARRQDLRESFAEVAALLREDDAS